MYSTHELIDPYKVSPIIIKLYINEDFSTTN